MKLDKAQEEIIKKKVGGIIEGYPETLPSKPIVTTMALGEEGNSPYAAKIDKKRSGAN